MKIPDTKIDPCSIFEVWLQPTQAQWANFKLLDQLQAHHGSVNFTADCESQTKSLINSYLLNLTYDTADPELDYAYWIKIFVWYHIVLFLVSQVKQFETQVF